MGHKLSGNPGKGLLGLRESRRIARPRPSIRRRQVAGGTGRSSRPL